ncbi:MAG: hypothetical protein C5B58_04870 [Acidobacteria bacterium]|nr:MAG: hypothetical protein C5B58_04870 [Acidobacteriota bacterium]
MLDRLFLLKEHGSSAAREVIAGLTTFAAMAYTLAVSPLISSQTGTDKGALVTATAIASAAMTIVMAAATNDPIALAPGMELDLRDFGKAAPTFVTIIMMPFTFSISEGIAFGVLTYVAIKLGAGKAKGIGVLTYLLAGWFLLYFLFEH